MELWKTINQMSESAESGWGSGYYHVVPKLIKKYNLNSGAEIGVAFGGHAEAMLKTGYIFSLYCIDPYRYDPTSTDGYTLPDGSLFNQQQYEELYLHAYHRLRDYRAVNFIRLDSTAGWAQLKRDQVQLDFVFIDAKHTFEDVYTDIFIWEKLVKKGGWILGHDYKHESYPGVTQAVYLHFGSKVEEFDGHVWGVRKTW